MKKLTLTSILALCMACPAMANIDKDASTATCDSNTIGTTTGPANLEADWTANTIHLDWYSNDTKQTSTTCTYDGGITLPNTPEVPTGYTFGGWKVRVVATPAVSCGLSTWSLGGEEDFIDGGAKSNSGTGYNDNDAGLNNGEWFLTVTNGTLKGIASCNNISGNNHDYTWGGNSDDWSRSGDTFNTSSTGQYCWCRATELNSVSCPVASTSWVFVGAEGDFTDNCADNCAIGCVQALTETGFDGLHRAMFGQNQ